jgi:thioredoxin-dependent peroxiredoxin
VRVGRRVPRLTLADEAGQAVRLADHEGERVVLFFLPRAGTAGCDLEAREFAARYRRFRRARTRVYGVGADKARKLARIRAALDLPFPLIADHDHRLSEAFGVWREKVHFGRPYMGIVRSTFLVGPDGRVARAWVGVSPPEGHAEEVLAAVRAG